MTDGSSDTDALRRFSAELRDLRRVSGEPSFREMARRAHFSSSTLAEATQGRRMPSQQVVEAFAVACGADAPTWAKRWQDIMDEITAHRAGTAGEPDSPGRAGARRPRWVLPAQFMAVAVCGFILGALVMEPIRSRGPSTAIGAPMASFAVPHDGADPGDAGCAADATVSARIPLTSAGHTLGLLELRYSRRCAGGWARYVLATGAATAMVELRLEAQDGRAVTNAQPAMANLPVYTDLLRPHTGCLRAIAAQHASDQLLTATTACLPAPGPS